MDDTLGSTVMGPDDIDIRPWTDGDEEAVLALLQRSLKWTVDERRVVPRLEAPGRALRSLTEVVAMAGDRLVGRAFSRWRFRQGSEVLSAVRGRRHGHRSRLRPQRDLLRLTRGALDELQAAGIDFVFNTPNEQSRPGYLKMGWIVLGRSHKGQGRLRPAPSSPRRAAGQVGGYRPGLPAAEVLAGVVRRGISGEAATRHPELAVAMPEFTAAIRLRSPRAAHGR